MIAGIALKSPAKLGVVSIEPLGREIEMFDITTGTGDFIADGVVSTRVYIAAAPTCNLRTVRSSPAESAAGAAAIAGAVATKRSFRFD
jgi:hypothetical protein